MKARHLLISILTLIALTMPGAHAQSGFGDAVNQRAITTTFAAQAAVGQTASFDASGASFHTINLVVTGGPSGCTYRLQGSVDGGNTWFNISASDITCTSSITTFESSAKVARWVRGNLLTLTGGTSPTVTLQYGGR